MLKIYTGSVIVKREDAWIHYKCRSKEISPCKKAEISTTCSNCNQPFQDNEEKVIPPLLLLTYCTVLFNPIGFQAVVGLHFWLNISIQSDCMTWL